MFRTRPILVVGLFTNDSPAGKPRFTVAGLYGTPDDAEGRRHANDGHDVTDVPDNGELQEDDAVHDQPAG